MAWEYMWIFLIVSAVLCAVGFYKFVYFMSVGYGLSVAGLGIAYFCVLAAEGFEWNFVTVLQCLLLLIYGIRLSGFLIIREVKNISYRKVLKEATKEDEKPMPFFVKFILWVSVAVLYIVQTCPILFRVYNGYGYEVTLPLIGAIISAAGIIIETISDNQKSAQKKVNPDMVATKGLYKFIRCPNYFGELLFWAGILIGALNALEGVGQWIAAVLGFVIIAYVMFDGAKRLDKRQEKRYGDKEEYRQYADHTPIILPVIPLYHIGKYKD